MKNKSVFEKMLILLVLVAVFSFSSLSVSAVFNNCPGDTVNGWWDINNIQTVNTTENIICEYINISNGGRLYVNSSMGNHTVNITVGNLTIQAGGEINGTGTGFANASGEGTGVTQAGPGGGGHGGRGGAGGTSSFNGGNQYGNPFEPRTLGSGGGGATGGDGGGAVLINVSNITWINGTIVINGEPSKVGTQGAGGAGGSLFLDTDQLYGTGTLQAKGGQGRDTSNDGGSGGGGRIAVYYQTFGNEFSFNNTNVESLDSPGQGLTGDPGTAVFVHKSNKEIYIVGGFDFNLATYNFSNITIEHAFLRVNRTFELNATQLINVGNRATNLSCYNTSYDFTIQTLRILGLDNTNISDQGRSYSECGNITIHRLETKTNYTINNLYLFSNRTVIFNVTNDDLILNATSIIGNLNITNLTNLSIYRSSSINATARGNLNGTFEGKGTNGNGGGGGGYGGIGGDGESGVAGGTHYGDPFNPGMFGAPGGASLAGGFRGTNGGGLVYINISGTLWNNGTIVADGEDRGASQGSNEAGVGSGGSIWIDTINYYGTGSLSARGGKSATASGAGGSGAGGRIAVYYNLINEEVSFNTTSVDSQDSTDPTAGSGYAGTAVFIDKNDKNLYIVGGFDFNLATYNFSNVTIEHAFLRVNRSFELNASGFVNVGHRISNMSCYNTTHDLTIQILRDLSISNFNLTDAGSDYSECGNITIHRLETRTNMTINRLTMWSNKTLIFNVSNDDLILNATLLTGNLNITNLTNLSIYSSSSINATARGNTNGTSDGAGAVASGANPGGGGGYGGRGAAATTGGAAGGQQYGDPFAPKHFGAPGGAGNNGANAGKNGGGIVYLNISGTLWNNGTIIADGEDSTGSTDEPGPGSGGSIWIDTANYYGTGTLTVRGGRAQDDVDDGGGGGGGRIAVYYNTTNNEVLFNRSIVHSQIEGAGATIGDPGTAVFIDKNDKNMYIVGGFDFNLATYNFSNVTIEHAFLRANQTFELNATAFVNTGGRVSNMSCYDTAHDFTIRTLRDMGLEKFNLSDRGKDYEECGNVSIHRIETRTNYSVNLLTLQSNGTLRFNVTDDALLLTYAQLFGNMNFTLVNLTMDINSSLIANFRGYWNGTGPGTGVSRATGGGAGYGGAGGAGTIAGSTGGSVYGSNVTPNDYGSGGAGSNTSGAAYGGNGGGFIFINASNRLEINGTINASGQQGATISSTSSGGGGSGGSIWLWTRILNGTGKLSAHGGNGANAVNDGGGGGGGRIAVYFRNDESKSFTRDVNGGEGTSATDGAAGTIEFLQTNDTVAPIITQTRPTAQLTTSGGGVVNISATVTDNDEVSLVIFNVTYPDATFVTFTTRNMSVVGNIYNVSFTTTTQTGTYNVTFFANDTSGNSNTTEKTNFIIDTAVPTADVPTFNVSTITKASGVKANTTAKDADSSIMNVSFNWFRNGSSVFTENFTSIANNTIVNSTLNATFYIRGDLINVSSVFVSDNVSNSTPQFSATLTVQNTLPAHGGTPPLLNSTLGTNTTSENLTVYNISAVDPDNDNLKYIINWYRNQTSITLLNMPFEDPGNGTDTVDYTSYQNNGSVNGAVYNATGGYDGKGAYTIDGTSDFINVPDRGEFTLTGPYSVEAWINNAPSTATWSGIVGTYTSGSSGFIFGLSNYGPFSAVDELVFWGGGTWVQSDYTITENGLWKHVVYTRNGTAGIFYVNGNVVKTVTATSGSDGGNLHVGDGGTGWAGNSFLGNIDEIKIYNITLSAAQINASYANRTDIIVANELKTHEKWNASMTPADGIGAGPTLMSNQVVIVSSATPTVDIPVFNVSSVTKASGVKANTTYKDGDGDPGDVYFTWFRNGSSIFTDNYTGISNKTIVNSSLSNTLYNRGDLINVTVYADDIGLISATQKSATTTVGNSSPTVSDPVFNVSSVTKTSGVKANVTYTHADSIAGSVYFNWFRNGSSVFTENFSAIASATIVNSTLNTSFYNKTDLLNITVFVGDGELNSSTVNSSTIIVANIPPAHATPILNSTNGTNTTQDNLTVYNVSTTDIDGDGVKNIISWYRNNSAVTVLNLPFEGGSNGTESLDYSSEQHNVTVFGADYLPTGGYDGKGAYNFSSTNGDYMTFAGGDIYDSVWTGANAQFSLSMWIKPSTVQTGNFLFVKAADTAGVCNSNARSIVTRLFTNSRFEFYWYTVGGLTQYRAIASTTSVNNINHWYHIVVTFDASGNNETNKAKIYIDGQQEAAFVSDSAGALGNIGDTNSFPSLGALVESPGTKCPYNPFNGIIDEFTVWNKTLTPQQVTALYNNQTNILVSNELNFGETWNASITPNDGSISGTTLFSNAVNLSLNTAPSLTDPLFNVSILNATTGIRANTTYTDVDNNSGLLYFRWYRNASEVFTQNFTSIDNNVIVNSTLGGVTLIRGDLVNMTVYASDGINSSSPVNSSTITVSNTAPLIEVPIFNVSTITKVSGVKINTTYRDNDTDAGTVYFAWFRNGTEIFTDNYTSIPSATIVNSTLSVGNYSKGDILNVTVYANDGTANSVTQKSSTQIIQNAAPTHATPILNTTQGLNSSEENLTVYNVSTADIEGDSVKNIVNWYRNQTSITLLNMPFEDPGNGTDTMDYTTYQNNGSVNGAVYNATGGYDGKGAYTIDGTSDFINVPDRGEFTLTGPYSVEAWINNAPSTATWSGIVGTYTSGSSGFIFGLSNYGPFSAVDELVFWGGGTWVQSDYTITENGLWKHVVYTRNGTVGIFYVNGDVVKTVTATSGSDGGNLHVGDGGTGWAGNSFLGNIDEIKIYNITLSAAQINASYANRTTILVTNELKAYETWNASITPNDGNNSGATLFSTSITITGTAPTVTDPLFNVSSFNVPTGIRANTTYTDPEGNAGTVYFRWFRNASLVFTQNITNVANNSIVNSTLTGVNYIKGDQLNITVYAADATLQSTTVNSSTLTVVNTLPTHGTPILNSSLSGNNSNENLTIFNITTSDLDADPVFNIYQWRRNDYPLFDVNLPFEAGSNNTFTRNYNTLDANGSVSGATWNATGGYNGKGAYYFDGINDFVEITNTSIGNYTNNFTLLAIIRPQPRADEIVPRIIDRGGTTSTGYVFFYRNLTRDIGFQIASMSGMRIATTSGTGTVPFNEFSCVASTYNGTTILLYVNGTERSSTNFTGFALANTTDTTNLHFGVNLNENARNFNGTIDEILVINKLLSRPQIEEFCAGNRSTILSNELVAGDWYQGEVTPNDNQGDGVTLLTNILNISGENAPTIDTPVFNVSIVTKTTGIKANSTYKDTDNNVGNITFAWFRNNTNIFNETILNIATGTIINSTLNVTFYNRSDLLNVTVIAFDGTLNSTMNVSTTLTVNNTVPTQGTPILNSTRGFNNTDENLTTFNISVSDPDNDGITTYYEWFRNGVSYLNTTTNILSTGNLTGGLRWNASIIVSDLLGNSTATFTNTVTINYLNVTLFTPENGTRWNNVNQTFTFNVTAGAPRICSLFNNDTGTFRNVTSISGISQNGNNTLNHSNILENDTIVWNVECISPEGTIFAAVSNYSLAVDRTTPVLAFTSPVRTNQTTYLAGVVNPNVSCTDSGGIFAFLLNITNATGQSVYENLTSSISGTSFTLAPTILFANNVSGTYQANVQCSDDHTRNAIGTYRYAINKNSQRVGFEPAELAGSNITIEAVSSSLNLRDVYVTQSNDRYSFTFDWFPDIPSRQPYTMVYHVTSAYPLHYRNNSLFVGHFVSGNNWIDFEGVNGTYTIFENATGWYVQITTNDSYHNFSSIGGLNIVQENVSFVYDAGFDIANATNITFRPDPIRQNDVVSFNATFNVTGNTNATGLNVTLTVDNLFVTSTFFTLVNGTTRQVELNWTAENGTHTIRLNADANNTFTEVFENNNNATATITVFNVSVLNFTSPSQNAEIIRGRDTNSLPGEDTLKKVSNMTTIQARVYNKHAPAIGVNSNCTYYFNNSIFLGWNQTNATGECTFTYDHTIYATGIYNITVNYTNLNTTNYLADTNASLIQNTSIIDLGKVEVDLDADNQRVGSVYNPGDVAVMNITVTKNSTAFDPDKFIVEVKDPGTECNSAGGVLFNHSYPGDIVRLSTGLFQSYSVLEADTDVHWCVVVNNSAAAPLGSASHSDKEVTNTNANRANLTIINSASQGDDAVFDDVNISFFSSRGNYRIFDRNFSTEDIGENRVFTLNERYSILFRHPARQEQLNITGLNMSAGNKSLPFNLLINYSGALPLRFTNMTDIIAFNSSGFSFTSANITLQKNNVNATKIVHCTNWNFSAGACIGIWEINQTSDYANFGENATHMWFQVTGFTAYAGGNGSNANLTIYDQADAEGGSIAAQTGNSINFTANYTRAADNVTITGASCNISFSTAPLGPSAMTYNSAKQIYNFTRTFNATGNFTWNATCGAASFDTLTAADTIEVLDTTAPVVSAISPTSITSGQQYTFSATVTDGSSPLTCNLFINNANDGVMTVLGTTASRVASYNVSSQQGISFYANCTDPAGNNGFNITNVTVAPQEVGGGNPGGGTRAGGEASAATADGLEGGMKYLNLGQGDVIPITEKNVKSQVRVLAVYPNSVRLDVGGYNLILLEGLFKRYDLNNNGILETTIYVDDVVSYSKVAISILVEEDGGTATQSSQFFDVLGNIWQRVVAEQKTDVEETAKEGAEQTQEQAQESVAAQEEKQKESYTKRILNFMVEFGEYVKSKGGMTGDVVAEQGKNLQGIISSPAQKAILVSILTLGVLVPAITVSYVYRRKYVEKKNKIAQELEEEMKYKGL